MTRKLIAGLALSALVATAFALGAAQGGAVKAVKGVHFAVVDGDGTLLRKSKDVVGALREGTGQYRVEFKGIVYRCAKVVSIDVDPFVLNEARTVEQGYDMVTNKNVFVITRDDAGNQADKRFNLVVYC